MTDDTAGFAAELIPASRVGHAPKFAGHEDPAHGHEPNRHDDRTRAFCLVIETPLEDSLLDTWLDLLRSLTGPDMLRIKSIINLRGRAAPVVIRCVQHLFHPPVELPAWPDDDRLSKIVFITCDVARQTIERKPRHLARCLAEVWNGPIGADMNAVSDQGGATAARMA